MRLTSDRSLIQSIRQSDGPDTGEGMLSRMWNVNLEEKDTEFYDDLREASGIGKRSKRKKVHHLFGFRTSDSASL
jgi:hypothetical protein